MIAACENGEIDLIITKSVSRWVRNTLDFLQNIRKLKALGIMLTGLAGAGLVMRMRRRDVA